MFGGKSVQDDQKWPQELMGGDGSTVLLYQPQVESWKDYKLLRARMAVAFRRMGTRPRPAAPVLEGDTATNREAGQVRISNIRILEGRFPALSPSESDRLLNALRARMTKEDVVVALSGSRPTSSGPRRPSPRAAEDGSPEDLREQTAARSW